MLYACTENQNFLKLRDLIFVKIVFIHKNIHFMLFVKNCMQLN